MPEKLMDFELNPDGKTINIVSNDGTEWYSVPKEKAPELVATGDWRPMSKSERIDVWKSEREQQIKEEYSNKSLEAAIQGFSSGLSFGLTDVLAEDWEKQHLRRLREENPISSVAGEIGSYLVPFGGVSALGKIGAKVGTKLAAKIASKGIGSKTLVGAAKLAGAVEANLMKNGVAKSAAKDIASKFVKDTAAKSLATQMTIGAVEGAAIGVHQQIKDLGLYNKPISPADIAKSATVGAITAGFIGGIGYGAKKIHEKVSPLIFKNERKLYELKKTKDVLQKELDKYSDNIDEKIISAKKAEKVAENDIDWVNAFQERIKLQKDKASSENIVSKISNLEEKIIKIHNEISSKEQSLFKEIASKTLPKSLFGGAIGFSTGGVLGATIGYVGGTLFSKTSKLQYKILRKIYDETSAKALSNLSNTVRKTSTGTLNILTKDEIKEIKKDIETTNQNTLYNNAYIGYRDAGVPAPLAEDFAAIQINRLNLLKTYLPNNINDYSQRVSFSKYVNAAMNPYSIIESINDGSITDKQIITLKVVFPSVWRLIQSEAKFKLENESNLTQKQLNVLKKINGYNNTSNIQIAFSNKMEEPRKTNLRYKPSEIPSDRVSKNIGG